MKSAVFRGCSRYSLGLCAWTACLLWSVSTGFAQGQGGTSSTLTTEDGISIRITYFPALPDKVSDGLANAPVVVMLHDGGGSRLDWEKTPAPIMKLPLPDILQERGYAVITVDLRKHGDSKIPGREEPVAVDDYPKMVLGDMAAVKQFIYTEHQAKKLNMAKLGVLAVGTSAAVAAKFTDVDWQQKPYDDAPSPALRTPRGQDVKAIIMLSPDATAGRLNTVASLRPVKQYGLAFLAIAGKEDSADKNTAKKSYDVMFTGKKDEKDSKEARVVWFAPPLKDRGMELFKRSGDVEKRMVTFLDEHLKTLSIPWQDRRSRLNRN